MRQILLLLTLLSQATMVLYAQTGTISGRVIDARSLEVLPYATVYINNTTIGTTTNATGAFFLSNLPLGANEIVFSFLGYASQQVTVVVDKTAPPPVTIRLNPDAKQVAEVNVKASRDKIWEKQFRHFEKAFLGNTATCKILNPWVVDFVEEKGSTIAKALLPLEIENRHLGYKLFFQLKRGNYSDTEFSFVGTTRFVELETTSSAQATNWAKERDRTYQGSLKHLLKSILDRQSNQQGFKLYRDKEKGRPRSKIFSYELEHNLLPLDTTQIISPASTINEYRIVLKDRLEVHYINAFVSPNFYSDVSDAVSWLETRKGYILVNKEGTLLNPADVAVSGNIADARISGMLPLDYKPGTHILVQTLTTRLAKRLQEAVYVHTDKPYYYPGDPLWFSAYMKYRVPGLMDSLSKVLYVDLINEDKRIVQTCILPLDSGRAANAIKLPANSKPGSYVLRAYTNWMRNYSSTSFFYKPIQVLSLDKRVGGVSPKPVLDGLLHIQPDKSLYQKKSLVKLTLRLDTIGREETGSFSIAVFDETLSPFVAEPTSIKTFDLPESMIETPAALPYPVEQGIRLTGVYTDKKGKRKKTSLTFVPENMSNLYPVTTGTNGEFTLSNLAFYDSARFIIQSQGGNVVLRTKDQPDLPEHLPSFNLPLVPLQSPHVVYAADTLQARMLTEVNVAAKKMVRSESSYGQSDVRLSGEELTNFATMADALAAKLPSFKLVQNGANWLFVWARASTPNSKDLAGSDLSAHEPNLYINNVLVVGETAGNRLMQLSPTMIDHIEVNGMISANQGANGSNGLVNVYTKRATNNASTPLSWVKARGFDHELQFRPPANSEGNPSTLYWNPRLNHITYDAPVTLSFFTASQSGTYRVVVEGITNKGHTVHAETVLTVIE